MNAHKLIGHGGTRKTLKQLSLDYYWDSLPFDVHETLMVSAECQKQKPFDNQVSYKFIKPNYAWHTVSVDVVGPFDSSSLRNKYLIVAINHLTKWVEIRAIRT